MRRYNIAFYSDTYLPATDGVVTSMLDFRKELERRGHRVFIFASRRGIARNGASPEKDVFLYARKRFKLRFSRRMPQ